MSSVSDRNLLLGILALQLDFISREQLIAATNSWLADKARPLDEILLDQGALRADTHPLLVALVDKHLELHGGDAEKSLAAVSSIGPVRDELKKLGDVEFEASLSLVATDRDSIDPYETQVGEPSSGSSAGGRFRILRPHAKGGLGEVFVARDDELNREVALKEIQSQHAHLTDSRSRFLLEAEVTGGLEHPGIVPVYGLGQYGDGRPYYAMRFIRGDSLREAIERFHGNQQSKKQTQDQAPYDSVEFRKLLGRFVDVCNAIQYAHSRGVLHRDLKPGNIMLGKYGETLVVDWGLAKLQGRDEVSKVEGETTLQPSSGSLGAQTQFGSAIGTPAYMPPEQATGNLNELGPESDVYSLGATLYHLLVGQPPVTGSDVGLLLKRVQQGDFPTPRQLKPTLPKPLDAICQRAMQMRAQDRYASPQELADDVERYLADEPVTAHDEPLTVRARRWVRKHQTVAVTTAAVVLLSAIGLGVLSTVVTSTNRQLARSNQREKDATKLAQANEHSAQEQGQLAFDTMTSVIEEIQVGLANVAGGSVIRRRLLRVSLAKLEGFASRYVEQANVDHETIWGLLRLGKIVLQFGSENGTGTAVGDGARELSEEQQSAVELAGTYYHRAHEIALQLAADKPGNEQAERDLAVCYARIGDVQLQSGRSREALESHQISLQLRQALAADHPWDTLAQYDMVRGHNNLGDMQRRLGETSSALDSYMQGKAIVEQLAAKNPDDREIRRELSTSYNHIGHMQIQLGRTKDAVDAFLQSVEIAEKLLADDQTDALARHCVLAATTSLGEAQLKFGQPRKSLVSCRRGLEVAKQLAAVDPANRRAQSSLSVAYRKLGDVQRHQKKFNDALASYQQSMSIEAQRAEADPHNAETQRNLYLACDRVGVVRQELGQSSEALALFQQALAISEKQAAVDPADDFAQQDMSDAYSRIGDVQLKDGQSNEALALFHKSLEIDKQQAANDPDNALVHQDLLNAHYRLGELYEALSEFEKAAVEFAAGAAVARWMVEQEMNVERSRTSILYMEKAAASATEGMLALDAWDKVLEQPADSWPALFTRRAVELAKQGRFREAAEAAAKLRTLPSADGEQLYKAARVFSLCAAAVKADEGEALSAEQQTRRAQYIANGRATLQAAVLAGWVDFPRMREILTIFAELPDFQTLLPETDPTMAALREVSPTATHLENVSLKMENIDTSVA